MKRIFLPLVVIVVICASIIGATAAWGQNDPPTPAFTRIQQLGQVRPQGIRYDPNFDRMVAVDASQRLVLVEAATFAVEHVLYEGGTYSTYTFSHDGRWLAVGIDRRVDLWDTQTGQLAASVQPEEALAIQDPLQFAPDDSLLMINALAPAPAELRRSENDTSSLPYLWDLPAARDEARTTLPRNLELYTLYDYRDALIIGPDHTLLGALSGRLQVLDVVNNTLQLLTEIDSERHAPDPVSAWLSAGGDLLYVHPFGRDVLVQLDADPAEPFEIPVGRELDYRHLRGLDRMRLGPNARILGDPVTHRESALLRLILGGDYRPFYGNHALTVMLLDVLHPLTAAARDTVFLIYLFDEDTGRGTIDALRLPDVNAVALHPEGTHLLVRRASGAQPIEVYNLATGTLDLTVFPAIADPDGQHILSYNATGDVIISDFQRFDAVTGAVLVEDLHLRPGFQQFYFSADSQQVVTITGSQWWLWDIASGEVIRRERFDLRGQLLATSPDGHRFLTSLETNEGRGVEVLDIGEGTRHSIIFQALPDQTSYDIYDMVPSPDWQHFLVLYPTNPHSPHYPGSTMMIYSLRTGQHEWFIAGTDLPPNEMISYGWLDDETVYLHANPSAGGTAPDRIYGLDMHGSGLPACLVTRFPEEWTRWVDLWERLNATLRSDSLGRLAERLCAAEPATLAEVDAVFFPTPTATRPPRPPQTVIVAGVPDCLTTRFPREALDYATIWRDLTAEMEQAEIDELAEIICEGLGRVTELEEAPPLPRTGEASMQIMTINVITGQRAIGSYLPPRETSVSRSLEVVVNAFAEVQRFTPPGAQLSPDGRLLALFTPYQHVEIYRLDMPYESLEARATATAAPLVSQRETAVYLAVRPTATVPPASIGVPNPTLTPTITPTPPPTPDQPAPLPQLGQVEEVCSGDTLAEWHSPDDLPAGYQPPGRLVVELANSAVKWTLDPVTGALHPDERLPRCDDELGNCIYSADRQWLIMMGDTITVSRANGSQAWTLFEERERPAWPEAIYWLDSDTIEFRYQGYLPDEQSEALTLLRHVDPATGTISEPLRPAPPIRINELYTEVFVPQPQNIPLAVVRTSFSTGRNTGFKYYIVDRETSAIDYFARLAEDGSNELELVWNPLGHALYYRYPSGKNWFIYHPATRQHTVLGDFQDGTWSRDGRFVANWIVLSQAEIAERSAAGLPLPKLRIWDSTTGLTRLFCIPGTADLVVDTPPLWSPDHRYLAFQMMQPRQIELDASIWHTLVLDSQTGSVTVLTNEAQAIQQWIGE